VQTGLLLLSLYIKAHKIGKEAKFRIQPDIEYPTMSAQGSRRSTLSGKEQRKNSQTSDIRRMNQNGKRQAIGNGNELRVRARNKSATRSTYE
jgi:hypothetical protein